VGRPRGATSPPEEEQARKKNRGAGSNQRRGETS